MTALVVEATYENGVLKPSAPLPLKEHEKVRVTVQPAGTGLEFSEAVRRTAGLIPCNDAGLIERIALEPIEEL